MTSTPTTQTTPLRGGSVFPSGASPSPPSLLFSHTGGSQRNWGEIPQWRSNRGALVRPVLGGSGSSRRFSGSRSSSSSFLPLLPRFFFTAGDRFGEKSPDGGGQGKGLRGWFCRARLGFGGSVGGRDATPGDAWLHLPSYDGHGRSPRPCSRCGRPVPREVSRGGGEKWR